MIIFFHSIANTFRDGSGKYRLVGFISHMGTSPHSGHYVAHLLRGGRWVLYNDEKVEFICFHGFTLKNLGCLFAKSTEATCLHLPLPTSVNCFCFFSVWCRDVYLWCILIYFLVLLLHVIDLVSRFHVHFDNRDKCLFKNWRGTHYGDNSIYLIIELMGLKQIYSVNKLTFHNECTYKVSIAQLKL